MGGESKQDLLRKKMRARAEADFYWFCRHILGYTFLHEPLHKKICDFAVTASNGPWKEQDEQWALLLAPRGHGKSTLWTAAHTIHLHLCAKDPTFAVGIVHALRPQAVKIMSDIKFHFENNKLLKFIAPELCYANPAEESPIWRQDEIAFKRTAWYKVPSVVAFSIDASVVGLHFDVIKCDDLVIDINSKTKDQRESVDSYINRLKALLKVTGWKRIHLAGTRWHNDDAYQRMLDRDGPWKNSLKHLLIDCYDETGAPAWPTAFTKDELLRQEALDPHLFSCNYRNNPIPEGMASFSVDNIQRYSVAYTDAGEWIPPDPDERYVIYTAVDPNTRESTAYDAGVVLTAAKDSVGRMYVIDIDRGHPSPSELVSWMRRHTQKYKPAELMIEVVQAQYQFVHWLSRDTLDTGTRYPVREVRRGPSERKYDRIIALSELIRSSHLFIPHGQRFEPIMDELRAFSPRAQVDDCLDCFADIYSKGMRAPASVQVQQLPTDTYLLNRLISGGTSGVGVRESMFGVRTRA